MKKLLLILSLGLLAPVVQATAITIDNQTNATDFFVQFSYPSYDYDASGRFSLQPGNVSYTVPDGKQKFKITWESNSSAGSRGHCQEIPVDNTTHTLTYVGQQSYQLDSGYRFDGRPCLYSR